MAGGESGEGERDWREGPPPRADSAFLSTSRGPALARPLALRPYPNYNVYAAGGRFSLFDLAALAASLHARAQEAPDE